MQAIMETGFDIVYLSTVITIGILMIRGSRGNGQFRLFGFMAVCWAREMRSISFPGRLPCAPRAWRTTRSLWVLESGSPPLP